MPQFSLRDILRGITLASVGFGMLAMAFHGQGSPASKEQMLSHAFLVGFGGMFVGYGLAFPIKYPPHQMILAMIGMFAAEAWDSGHSFGLLVYLGLMAFFGCVRLIQNRRARLKNSRE